MYLRIICMYVYVCMYVCMSSCIYVCMFVCSIGICCTCFVYFVDVNIKLLFQLTNVKMELTLNIIRQLHVRDVD